MISVGIIGGTGYSGMKLIQYLDFHPFVNDLQVYAKKSAGRSISEIFPMLSKYTPDYSVKHTSDLSFKHDLYFIALPVGDALSFVPSLIGNGKYVIDLGGDYRLDYEEIYSQWYNFTHTSSYLLREKIYGLADHTQTPYGRSRLIANPGCYPTAVLLSILPLLPNLADEILSVSCIAYSGTTGAGKKPDPDLMLSEMYGNAKAYNVNKHKHEPEILQQLYKNGFHSPLSFTTHLLPAARGIYSTISIHLHNEIALNDLNDFYSAAYKDSFFVRLRNNPPELQWVIDSNFCDINISVKEKILIITAAIDNLVKGASGQAVQNMNKIYGWNETTGLLKKELCYV